MSLIYNEEVLSNIVFDDMKYETEQLGKDIQEMDSGSYNRTISKDKLIPDFSFELFVKNISDKFNNHKEFAVAYHDDYFVLSVKFKNID